MPLDHVHKKRNDLGAEWKSFNSIQEVRSTKATKYQYRNHDCKMQSATESAPFLWQFAAYVASIMSIITTPRLFTYFLDGTCAEFFIACEFFLWRQFFFFLMRPHISIRGSVRRSIGPSVSPSVGPSVGTRFFSQWVKYGGKWSVITRKTVYYLQTCLRVVRIVTKCPKMSQNVPNVPKCPIQTHHCPNGLVPLPF